MKLRTLIIDDEPIALEKLRSYVEKVPFLELAAACHSGIDAMAVLAAEKIDLIFTDIDMPDLNGMELAGSLADAPMIVFTTAYAQYAVDSYRLSAVDYLLKPYSFADFQRAANKALAQAQRDGADTQREAGSVFVKVDYRYVRVKLDDIRYIKGFGEYLQIFTTSQPEPMMTLSSFASMAQKLRHIRPHSPQCPLSSRCASRREMAGGGVLLRRRRAGDYGRDQGTSAPGRDDSHRQDSWRESERTERKRFLSKV